MCGITGILNLDGSAVQETILQKMTERLRHRGPDSGNILCDSFVGLGHRRLAIIDLSPSGNQPMLTSDGRYAITYNGELYNYKELRSELEIKGYKFHSSSDTEVALNMFAEYGKNAISRFNGMFALVIWDKWKKELFLARDRYGIKPLYIWQNSSVFLFASEIKSFFEHPDFKTELDKEALLEYFTFQNFYTEKTLFKNVKIFPAGYYASINADTLRTDSPLQMLQYWDFCFQEPEEKHDEQEYLEELDRLLVKAVKSQLVSDVPVGAYLSGGIDSGLLTAISARELPYMTSFTCGFDTRSASGMELAFDEREKAEYMSYLFRTEHYEMVLKAGDMERVMPRLVWHMEEPRVGQSYPNFYAAQLAGKFVKVVLSGSGGDELFGGYPWRYFRDQNNADPYKTYYRNWQRLIPAEAMPQFFKPIWKNTDAPDSFEIFKKVFAPCNPDFKTVEGCVNASLYFEAKTFLHGLLVVEDKLSMSHSLETRVPFLDNELVDFATKLPMSLKLNTKNDIMKVNENESGVKNNNFFTRSKDGKRALRKVTSKYVPDEITQSVKQGFSAPDASWFKGESIDYVKGKLLSKDARIYEYMDHGEITGLLGEHFEGKENRRLLIWSLLDVEQWLSTFM